MMTPSRDGDPAEPAGFGAYLVGRILDGRYAIRSVLGTGGMGTVYRAEQYSMHRDVAVKIMRPDIVNETSIHRFLNEARAASRLKSPYTVTVFDFGRTSDGILYLAMELLEGQTLAQELQKEGKPFGTARTTRLIGQVLNSVEEAHSLGILHRDLKPDNVFLLDVAGSRDFPKILDFGVAKMRVPSATRTTVGGMSFGTPLYMSPEQATNQDPCPATDLYSIAVMLFELMAGKTPWENQNPIEIAMAKAQGKTPGLRQVNPRAQTSDALDAFLAWCLSPDPARRPQDVATFREAFEAAMHSVLAGTPCRPPAWPSAPPPAAAQEPIPGIPIPPPAPARSSPPPEPAPSPTPTAAPARKSSRPLDRRKRPRTPCLGNVVCLSDGARHKALLAEASETGAFLYSSWLPRPGEAVSIQFRLADEAVGPPIIVSSQVVRVMETPAIPGGVRGFSVKWLVLRTQGRLSRLKSFYRNMFGVDLPATHAQPEARLWEYWFEDRMLQHDVPRRKAP